MNTGRGLFEESHTGYERALKSQYRKEVCLTSEISLNARAPQPFQLPWSQKTTDMPSRDSGVLQVTGPSSQPWRISSSWKKTR